MKINKTLLIATIITLSLASTIFPSQVNAYENIPNVKLTRAEKLLRKMKVSEESKDIETNDNDLNLKYKERLERLALGRLKNHEKLVNKLDLEITNLSQKNLDTSKAKSLFKEYKNAYSKLSIAKPESKIEMKKEVAKLLKELRKEVKFLEKNL